MENSKMMKEERGKPQEAGGSVMGFSKQKWKQFDFE